MKIPKVIVNNFNLYYEIYGDSFPLIMVLGLGANSDWWGTSFLNKLSEHFKVVVFDNRGTGQSDDPNLDYSITTLAEDVLNMMDSLNIEHAYIFGHSMGGLIVQELVLNYEERFKKVVLCSSSCGGPESITASPKVLEIVERPREGRAPEEIARETLSILYTDNFLEKYPKFINLAIENMSINPMSSINYDRQRRAILSFKSCVKLRSLKLPVLIMHGKEDLLVPSENVEVLAKLIPHADIMVFSKSAHAPYVEEPKLFLKTLIDFLKL